MSSLLQHHATLYRIDMVDAIGTRFCPECAADAYESGLFSDYPNS